MIPAGSCRTFLSDPDIPYIGMPQLPEATVNTTRLLFALFLHLCHVAQCRTTRSSVHYNTSIETRAQGILMCLQRMTRDIVKVIS